MCASESILSDSDAGQAWPPLSSSPPVGEGTQNLGNENGRFPFRGAEQMFGILSTSPYLPPPSPTALSFGISDQMMGDFDGFVFSP